MSHGNLFPFVGTVDVSCHPDGNNYLHNNDYISVDVHHGKDNGNLE